MNDELRPWEEIESRFNEALEGLQEIDFELLLPTED